MATTTASRRPELRSECDADAPPVHGRDDRDAVRGAYGNLRRGRPGQAPSVPVGSAALVRTDSADAHGWPP